MQKPLEHLYLKSLYLRDFRNFSEKEFHFSPGINQIHGPNGLGKTNLIEAISLITTGKSFRSAALTEMIKDQNSFFYIEAEIEQNQITQTICLHFDGKNKKLKINSTSYVSFLPLLGNFPIILHAPQDSSLIEGSPILKRRLVNLHLAQKDPLYIHHLTRFERALTQRNLLLKSKQEETLFCFEKEMTKSALYLLEKRKEWIDHLNPYLRKYGEKLSGKEEKHELRYTPSFSEDYEEKLIKNRKKELFLGQTLIGPHRDDFSFWIDDKMAKAFASEGQKKSTIASLRLAQWDLLKDHFEQKPFLAIDDFGISLDGSRQANLYEKLESLGQVFITSPHILSFSNSHCITI